MNKKILNPNQMIKKEWKCEDGHYIFIPFRILPIILLYPLFWIVYLGIDWNKVKEKEDG